MARKTDRRAGQPGGTKPRVRKLVFTLGALLALLLLLLLLWGRSAPGKIDLPENARDPADLEGLVSRLQVAGSDIAWLGPDQPWGIVFAFHGCTHDAQDWFLLPEESVFVRKAIGAGLMVLAISSADRRGKCWNINVDTARVRAIIDWVVVGKKWDHLPLFAVGASSGGTFAATLPTYGFAFKVLAIFVSPGLEGVKKAPRRYPVVNYVYMAKDTMWASRAAIDSAIAAGHFSAHVYEVRERPLPLALLQASVPTLGAAMSTAFHRQLLADGRLNPQSQLLTEDPRKWDSQMLLARAAAAVRRHLPTDREVSSVQELLNACFASHEMTREFADEVIASFFPFRLENSTSTTSAPEPININP